jgi:hypothetical protein
LPRPDAHILSIGCGTGLLEMLLQSTRPKLQIEVVEVASCPVKYWPVDRVHAVGGTWDLCPVAATVDVWLFVYPRQASLVAAYLSMYQNNSVTAIIWIGPKADWEVFRQIFVDSAFSSFEQVEDNGLAGYEAAVVIRRAAGVLPSHVEGIMSIEDI